MSFESLSQPEVEPIIRRFAEAAEITLLIGAGASMEASLPSWPELIRRLLEHVSNSQRDLTDPTDRAEWIRRTLESDELLGAGADVEVLAAEPLTTLLPQALYGDAGVASYEPGPIASQVAELRRRFGDAVILLTTNYDDLLERALLAVGYTTQQVRSYVQHRTDMPQDTVPVTHLHGYAGRTGRHRGIVLTEGHYHRMQRGRSWQEQLVVDRLQRSQCLFIGTSLADPNLIRYLYGYRRGSHRHAAVFIRQGDLDSATPAVRRARENAIARRWGRCGVEALFLDHYADAAQFVHEIALCRESAADYSPAPARASRTIGMIEEILVRSVDGGDDFADRQIVLSRWLRSLLYNLLTTAVGADVAFDDERLALALWIFSRDGTRVTGWAHSDRAHQDPRTVEAVRIGAASEWVAVRTICQGVRVDDDTHSSTSRWRFVRGLPLVLEEPTRIPIGCLTISSTKLGGDTLLNRLTPAARSELHRGLTTAVLGIIGQLEDIASSPPDPLT